MDNRMFEQYIFYLLCVEYEEKNPVPTVHVALDRVCVLV